MRGIDDERLVKIVEYLGKSPRALALLADRGEGYLSSLLRGKIEDPRLSVALGLAKAAGVPMDAFLTTRDPHGGALDGWHLMEQHGNQLHDVLAQMARADCITAVSDDMDSYLIPYPMVEIVHRDKFAKLGLAGEMLEQRIDSLRRVAEDRLKLREQKSYVHHIIGPARVVLNAHQLGHDWCKDLARKIKDFKDWTATAFVKDDDWPHFYAAVQHALPSHLSIWRKVNIADDIIAMVWVGLDIWYSYQEHHVLKLRQAVEGATRAWAHKEFPIDMDHRLTAMTQRLRNWHNKSENAVNNILEGKGPYASRDQKKSH
jgi:hypothetical protein